MVKFISSFLTVPLCLVSSSSAFVVTTNKKQGMLLPSLFAPPAGVMHPLVGVPPVPASRKQMIGSTSTTLPMSVPLLPEGALTFDEDENTQDEIFRLIDELAWEGVDPDEAKKLLESELVKTTGTSLGEDLAIAATEVQEFEMASIDPCTDAVIFLTVDMIGLLMDIIGVPSTIGKKVAKKLAKKAQKKLQKEIIKIAKTYFQDASDIVKVSQGVWEFLQALLSIFTIDAIIGAIFGEMTWWEVITYSAWITAQVALLFAASAPALVVKLALVTPSIIEVVASTVKVANACD